MLGKTITNLTSPKARRTPDYYRPQTRPQSFSPEPELAWFSLNSGEDFSSHSVIAQVAKHIKAENVSRAWSLTSGSSIIFTLPENPVGGVFEHGGRSFTVSPFTLGSDLVVSPVSLEPDFDKIFEVDSNEGAALDDDLHRMLDSVRHLRTNLGLDALSAAHDAVNQDEPMEDPAAADSLLYDDELVSGTPDGADLQTDASQPVDGNSGPSPESPDAEEGEASEAEGDDLPPGGLGTEKKGSPAKKAKKDPSPKEKKPKKKKEKGPVTKPVAAGPESRVGDTALPKDPGKLPK